MIRVNGLISARFTHHLVEHDLRTDDKRRMSLVFSEGMGVDRTNLSVGYAISLLLFLRAVLTAVRQSSWLELNVPLKIEQNVGISPKVDVGEIKFVNARVPHISLKLLSSARSGSNIDVTLNNDSIIPRFPPLTIFLETSSFIFLLVMIQHLLGFVDRFFQDCTIVESNQK